MEVCTAVQRGLYASGWQQGRLSHLEMPVWLFHRYLAARIRGAWPTDDRPAAPGQRAKTASPSLVTPSCSPSPENQSS
jgi:hypothetical protein